MAGDYLVQRIAFDSDDFAIEQTIATISDVSDDLTPEQLIETAYDEANMSVKTQDTHVITQLGEQVEIEPEALTSGRSTEETQ